MLAQLLFQYPRFLPYTTCKCLWSFTYWLVCLSSVLCWHREMPPWEETLPIFPHCCIPSIHKSSWHIASAQKMFIDWHWTLHFTCIVSFSPLNNPMRRLLLLSSHKWGNWILEKLSNWLRLTRLLSGKENLPKSVGLKLGFLTPSCFSPTCELQPSCLCTCSPSS